MSWMESLVSYTGLPTSFNITRDGLVDCDNDVWTLFGSPNRPHTYFTARTLSDDQTAAAARSVHSSVTKSYNRRDEFRIHHEPPALFVMLDKRVGPALDPVLDNWP